MPQILTYMPLDVDANHDFLLAAHRETSRLTFGTTYTDEQIEREIERERNISVGVYLNSEIVGLCDVEKRIKKNGESYGWVHFFYLMLELRGQGLGVQLIEQACRFCRGQGLQNLLLRVGEPNVSAYHFYERNGFERAPELDKQGEFAFVKSIKAQLQKETDKACITQLNMLQ